MSIRTLGVFMTFSVWFLTGIVVCVRIAQLFAAGQSVPLLFIVALIAAVATCSAALSNDAVRFAATLVWAMITGVCLVLIVAAGLFSYELAGEITLALFVYGAFSVQLLSMSLQNGSTTDSRH